MKTGKLLVILVGLISVLASLAAAQSETPLLQQSIGGADSTRNTLDRGSRLNMVRQLIAQGALISAINLLENYYAEEPDNGDLIILMLNCYEQLKDFPKAEALLDKQMERHPDDFLSYYQLLDLYLRMGADSLLDRELTAIAIKFPANRDMDISIIHLLTNSGDTERARKLIQDRRDRQKDDNLFAFEMATVYSLKADYFQAVMECAKMLKGDSLQIKEVDRRVSMMIRTPGAVTEVIRALNAILEKNPQYIPVLRMLEEAYIRNNQQPEAYNICIQLDSLSGSGGKELFLFLRQCRDRKLFDQVVRMGDYIDRKYSTDWTLSEYRFYYGEALAGLGRYEEAIRQYRTIYDRYPQPRDKAEALLGLGQIYRYDIRDYDSARACFSRLASTYVFSPYDVRSRLELAYLNLVEGNLDSAETAFKDLGQLRLSSEDRELVQYNLAMIQFYRHNYADADLAFRKLMELYPRGFFMNDALQNSLIINDAAGLEPDVLTLYAEALLYEVRLMADSAEKALTAIVDSGDSPLIGMAGYKLAGLYTEAADTARALAIIDRMEKYYIANYYFPYCLKLKGDIYFNSMENRGQAAEIYKTILEKYGNYPFNGEVRSKLQELEGYRLPG